MKEPRLPKPTPDGKYSETWLNDFIERKYSNFDEMLGFGAFGVFKDLMELGLIRDEFILWDDEENKNAGTSPDENNKQTELSY